MSELTVTRSFAADLEVSDDDGRTIVGRCVPYDMPTRVGDEATGEQYVETWKRGAFRKVVKAPARVGLVFGHEDRHLRNHIGHAVELVENDEGLDAVFRAYDDDDARKAVTMIRDGACRGLSVRAVIATSRTRRDGVIERTLVSRLPHVALVPEAAFADARVTAVRASSSSSEGGSPEVLRDIRARQDEWRLSFPADS